MWIWAVIVRVFLLLVGLTKERYRTEVNILVASLLAAICIAIGLRRLWPSDRWAATGTAVCILALWLGSIKFRSQWAVQMTAMIGLLGIMLVGAR